MKTIKILLILYLTILIASCSNYDDAELWNKVNSLDNRITAIEQQLKTLNSDIDNIKTLTNALENRLYITNVASDVEGTTISFSDGTKTTINNGKDGTSAPIINVRFNGDRYYWVQTIDGRTDWLLDENGSMIPASGIDAITPLLRVDVSGYWQVSYNNGYTYDYIYDQYGGWVKATGSDGNSFFTSVTATDDEVPMVLSDGTEIVIPLGEQSPYKAVDLGLSVKWASYNIGASAPEQYGNLYLWGDPSGSAIVPSGYTGPSTSSISGTQYDLARAAWVDLGACLLGQSKQNLLEAALGVELL